MSHRSIAIVMSCLLALVWCQAAAAAGVCVSASPVAATADGADEPHARCHDGDDSVRCQSCDALSSNAQGAKAPADTAHALPAPLAALAIAHATSALAGRVDRTLRPRTPPHFLGRLLI